MHLSRKKMLEKLFFELCEDEDATIPDIIDYFHLQGDGSYKLHADNDREELANMAVNYIGVGGFASPTAIIDEEPKKPVKGRQNNEPKKHTIGDFSAKIDPKSEAIIVKMTTFENTKDPLTSEMTHRFVFTKKAIMNFYTDHPFTGRFAVPAVISRLMNSANDLRWTKEQFQTIINDRVTETVDSVERTDNGWYFEVSKNDGAINNAHADKIRFIAFAYAIDQALKEAVKGSYYKDLYRAICFSA